MIKAGNYIFALSSTSAQSVTVLNVSDYSVALKITGMSVGFAHTTDGGIWAAGGTSLIRIDPTTLAVQTTTLPFTAYGSWGAWHPGSITASTKENIVFLANNGTFSGGKTIYKYIVGNAASLSAPFISIATGKELYGAGIGYNASSNQLIVNTVQSGFGANYAVNDLDFYDAASGSLQKDVLHTGYYFPATLVFHQ
jgi:hypothetical protein